KKPNTSKIIALAKQKSYDTEKKVFETIKKMIKEKKVINYNTVSKESKISKSFLYKNDGIRKKIDMLRNKQTKLKRINNIKKKKIKKKNKISKTILNKKDGNQKKIDILKNEQSKLKSVVNHKPNTSDKSKDIIIESLKFKIERLVKENKDLKEALASKYNDFYKNL